MAYWMRRYAFVNPFAVPKPLPESPAEVREMRKGEFGKGRKKESKCEGDVLLFSYLSSERG
jgi:hypothetical protein